LLVAHLDHGLRKSSHRDALAVSRLAEKLGVKAIVGRADVKKLAIECSDNLEQAARRARYSFFERTARRKKAKLILVAHTMDDQAETVLLRLVRGSASEGLSGMEAIRPLSSHSKIQIVRPLLSWALRTDTENYCRRQNIQFLGDEMNQDENFARVKIRRQLLPLMQSFNNRIVETLFRTASLLREDSTTLAGDAAQLLERATERMELKGETNHPTLNVNVLAKAPAALRRRALRQWLSEGRGHLRRVEHVHLVGVERLLEGNRGGRVAELPDGTKVRRSRGHLELIVKKG
ncbi:MAG TPA: tRNA lysidine(34) synthetase TilS, partial [Pyrinomonadaceae bacterium]|nr:tRNA lysidine(34) synthetase TilS [Pyrinomonadaceae bacterium]